MLLLKVKNSGISILYSLYLVGTDFGNTRDS